MRVFGPRVMSLFIALNRIQCCFGSEEGGVAIIYVGAPCRGHEDLQLPALWENNFKHVIEPLGHKYGGPIRYYGWFNAEHLRGTNVKACHRAVESLIDWTRLEFNDTILDLRRRKGFEKDPHRIAKSGQAGEWRRGWALHQIAREMIQTQKTYKKIFLLRPDLWFRQPLHEWRVDEDAQVNVPHFECANGPHCGHIKRNTTPFWSSAQGPDAFYLLEADFVLKRFSSLSIPHSYGRTLLYRPVAGSYGISPPPNTKLKPIPTPKNPHGTVPTGDKYHILARPHCCITTHPRTVEAWEPIYSVGRYCCYTNSISQHRPYCYQLARAQSIFLYYKLLSDYAASHAGKILVESSLRFILQSEVAAFQKDNQTYHYYSKALYQIFNFGLPTEEQNIFFRNASLLDHALDPPDLAAPIQPEGCPLQFSLPDSI